MLLGHIFYHQVYLVLSFMLHAWIPANWGSAGCPLVSSLSLVPLFLACLMSMAISQVLIIY